MWLHVVAIFCLVKSYCKNVRSTILENSPAGELKFSEPSAEVGLVVHFCLSGISLVSCYLAVRHQLPMDNLLELVGKHPEAVRFTSCLFQRCCNSKFQLKCTRNGHNKLGSVRRNHFLWTKPLNDFHLLRRPRQNLTWEQVAAWSWPSSFTRSEMGKNSAASNLCNQKLLHFE